MMEEINLNAIDPQAVFERHKEMRALGIDYEGLDYDSAAVIEHVGKRLKKILAAWLIPTGGDR